MRDIPPRLMSPYFRRRDGTQAESCQKPSLTVGLLTQRAKCKAYSSEVTTTSLRSAVSLLFAQSSLAS